MKYLLDTNICIYLIKQKPLSVLEKLRSNDIKDLALSSITVAELEYGVMRSQNKEQNMDALHRFMIPYEIVDFTSKSAVKYGEIRTYLEKKGQIIGPMDLLIASIAMVENMILVTNNTKEFKRIPNLKLENWV